MSTDNTGGLAFPCDNVYTGNGKFHNSQGMTLRDYFAAKAMQVIYEKHWDMFMTETYGHPDEVKAGAANEAYELADAMMEARK